jgi:hypothetical protein
MGYVAVPTAYVLMGSGCAGLVWLIPGLVWLRHRRLRLAIHAAHALASLGLAAALTVRYPDAAGLWVAIFAPGGLLAVGRLGIGLRHRPGRGADGDGRAMG